MPRKRFEWKLPTRTLQLGDRTLIMGVLNVTPDSFSDGGKYADPDRAFARAIEMEEQGVDIIDIGAESTRPGSVRISEAEELRRLIPVLKRLQNKLMTPISVDTYKSGVAQKALEYGAEIINDPSGLTFDVQLARVVSNGDAGLILNHMRGTPDMWAKMPPMKNPIGTVMAELDASMHRARGNGVDPSRIVLDPGLGFGKRREQNSELIAQLAELANLGRPVLVGASRKQFLQQESEAAREFGTAAAVAAAILNGAHIVRVHDVASMLAVAQVADAIVASRPEPQEKEKEERRPERKPARARLEPTTEQRETMEPRPGRTELRPPPPRIDPRPAPSGPRPSAGARPPRTESGPPRSEARPPRTESRPPRSGERPSRGNWGPPRSESRPPRSEERPSRGNWGPPRGDSRPPRGDSRPPRSDSRSAPPRGDSRPPRGDSRPPRSDSRSAPPRGGPGSRPPSNRPTGKRPPGNRPTGSRPAENRPPSGPPPAGKRPFRSGPRPDDKSGPGSRPPRKPKR